MHVSTRIRTLPQGQAGASLLEVLIAVLILAIGLLGIAALQAVSLRNMQGAADRTGAVIQSYAILDIMRANRETALAGGYNTGGMLCEAPEGGDRADTDTALWIEQMQVAMGEAACGNINCGGAGCTVEVRWEERGTTESGENEQYTLTTETNL